MILFKKNEIYLTIAEAAALTWNNKKGEVGVHTQVIRGLIASGKLPAIKVYNFYLIRKKDLKLIQKRKDGHPFKRK